MYCRNYLRIYCNNKNRVYITLRSEAVSQDLMMLRWKTFGYQLQFFYYFIRLYLNLNNSSSILLLVLYKYKSKISLLSQGHQVFWLLFVKKGRYFIKTLQFFTLPFDKGCILNPWVTPRAI